MTVWSCRLEVPYRGNATGSGDYRNVGCFSQLERTVCLYILYIITDYGSTWSVHTFWPVYFAFFLTQMFPIIFWCILVYVPSALLLLSANIPVILKHFRSEKVYPPKFSIFFLSTCSIVCFYSSMFYDDFNHFIASSFLSGHPRFFPASSPQGSCLQPLTFNVKRVQHFPKLARWMQVLTFHRQPATYSTLIGSKQYQQKIPHYSRERARQPAHQTTGLKHRRKKTPRFSFLWCVSFSDGK